MSRYEDKDKFHAKERRQIRNAFRIFDQEGKGYCSKDDVGYIMRYLGSYPSDEELVTQILPQLQDETDLHNVKYSAFEPFMVRALVEHLYDPDSETTILQAFQVLEELEGGTLTDAKLAEYMKEGDYGFRDSEIESFLEILKEESEGGGATGLVDYEGYVRSLRRRAR